MYPSIPPSACAPGLIPTPSALPNISILSIDAALVTNHTATIPSLANPNHPTINVSGVDFCNVTITYTHPDSNGDDRIGVEAWLPLSSWNGRLQAAGGSGWFAGRVVVSDMTMAAAVGQGYAAVSTDAGQGRLWSWPLEGPPPTSAIPTWAQGSEPGTVNQAVVEDIFHVAIGEMPIMAKEVIASMYGQGPEYSYFSGCSQGGRQGLELAQRYPDAFDGIAAAAPGIAFPEFIPAMMYPHVLMRELCVFPEKCEFDHVTRSAIAACDGLDGVEDGLVAWEVDCPFDPFSLVGDKFTCTDTGETLVLRQEVAAIVNETWTGPRDNDGKLLWPGPCIDTSLSGSDSPSGVGTAMTVCSETSPKTCTPVEIGFGEDWARYFVEKNTSWTPASLTPSSFVSLFESSAAEWSPLAGTFSPDLAKFNAAGGKMITFHGTSDELLPIRGTMKYYDSVLARDASAADYFRFFPVNGLGHCAGGAGGQPEGVFEALRQWVEEGRAPDELGVVATASDGGARGRKLCPYPKRANLKEGASPDTDSADDWECV